MIVAPYIRICDTAKNLDLTALRSFVAIADAWGGDAGGGLSEPDAVGRLHADEVSQDGVLGLIASGFRSRLQKAGQLLLEKK